MSKCTGLFAESSTEDFITGEELYEGNTIYLLGVEGKVVNECGAWGWGSHEYVPWEELEKRVPHKNNPNFCYCDNFISFWELKWNFDDGFEWDGVPFIRKEGEDAPKSQEDKGTKKCPNCGSDLYEYCFMCCYEGEKVKKNEKTE